MSSPDLHLPAAAAIPQPEHEHPVWHTRYPRAALLQTQAGAACGSSLISCCYISELPVNLRQAGEPRSNIAATPYCNVTSALLPHEDHDAVGRDDRCHGTSLRADGLRVHEPQAAIIRGIAVEDFPPLPVRNPCVLDAVAVGKRRIVEAADHHQLLVEAEQVGTRALT